jgi:hypothetical protein
MHSIKSTDRGTSQKSIYRIDIKKASTATSVSVLHRRYGQLTIGHGLHHNRFHLNRKTSNFNLAQRNKFQGGRRVASADILAGTTQINLPRAARQI